MSEVIVPPASSEPYLVENEFERILAERIELKKILDGLTQKRKDMDVELGAMLAVSGLKSVKAVGHVVSIVEGKSSRINKELLVAAGVSVDQIAAATKTSHYQTVRVAKQREESA